MTQLRTGSLTYRLFGMNLTNTARSENSFKIKGGAGGEKENAVGTGAARERSILLPHRGKSGNSSQSNMKIFRNMEVNIRRNSWKS